MKLTLDIYNYGNCYITNRNGEPELFWLHWPTIRCSQFMIQPNNLQGWLFYNDGTAGTMNFVPGPG